MKPLSQSVSEASWKLSSGTGDLSDHWASGSNDTVATVLMTLCHGPGLQREETSSTGDWDSQEKVLGLRFHRKRWPITLLSKQKIHVCLSEHPWTCWSLKEVWSGFVLVHCYHEAVERDGQTLTRHIHCSNIYNMWQSCGGWFGGHKPV